MNARCPLMTLAREAAVDRAAFYGSRPYAHLREEFETRLRALRQAGDIPDRRDAQIAGLKDEVAALRQRLADRDTTITGLSEFRDQAIARLAAQHDEINRLRTQNKRSAAVHLLPAPGDRVVQLTRPARHGSHVIPVTSAAPNRHVHHDPDSSRMSRSGQPNRNTDHSEHGDCKNKAHADLMAITGGDAFRVRTYEKAARSAGTRMTFPSSTRTVCGRSPMWAPPSRGRSRSSCGPG
jgi:hypothetical protein